jgi:hypothetical protein
MKLPDWQWWVLIAVGWIALLGPGTIEGRMFPAAAPMELTAVAGNKMALNTAFFGRSSRLRPSCNFERIEWRLGVRGGRSVPVQIDLGPPRVRPDGDFSFGPWYVGIYPPEMFSKGSYANVYHRCRYFGPRSPWLTKTPFWN